MIEPQKELLISKCSETEFELIKNAVCVTHVVSKLSTTPIYVPTLNSSSAVLYQKSITTVQTTMEHNAIVLNESAKNSTQDVTPTTVTQGSNSQPQTLTTTTTTIHPKIVDHKQKALDYINTNVKSVECQVFVSVAMTALSSLETACAIMETQKEILKFKCSDADIIVIKTAVCSVEETTTLSPEEEILVQKQKALDYINHNVKSEECKQLAIMAATALSSLEAACALTETQKEFLISKCSETEFEVIKTAVCVSDIASSFITTPTYIPTLNSTSAVLNQSSTSTAETKMKYIPLGLNATLNNSALDITRNTVTSFSTSRPQTLTTTTTTIHPKIVDQKQKALDYINTNVKSVDCQVFVSVAMTALSSLETACAIMETQKEILKFKCSDADIIVIKTAVCSVEETTTLSPEEEILVQKQKALDYINNNVKSEDCKHFASTVVDALPSLDVACGMIETQKETLKEHCSEADIEVIKTAVCLHDISAEPITTSAPDKDADAHREKLLCVIDTQLSSKTCKATIRGQAEGKSDRVEGCNTLKMFEPLLAQFNCTVDDYNKLYEVICEDKDVPCTPIGTSIDPVDGVVQSLTSRCKSNISVVSNDLKNPTGCSKLASLKGELLANLICAPGDIEKLHQIVCNKNSATVNGSIAHGNVMDKAVEAIRTNLSKSFCDVFWYEIQRNITLDDLCLKVKSAGPTLVAWGSCTQDDYDTLEPIVCELHQKDEIHRTILTLSNDCKQMILDQERRVQELTPVVICRILSASHDALLSTQTCSEAELTKLNDVLCNKLSCQM
ncbi:unnamed protein product [Lymnaea stagnalis]|uniref:Uncharacterized protein n=1 Tax=Lymnaea stagnalis TaxID=6523 RepID=A0AAV2H9E0_LYMST